ncbi:5655_t:CDS:2, partial [Scutellospora calospora]
MSFKSEKDINLKEDNFIQDYNSCFTNYEVLDVGEIEWFYTARLKEYNEPILLKPVTISTLNEFVKELKRHLSIKTHDNILKIIGLTKPDCWNYYSDQRPNIQQIIERLNEIIFNEENENIENNLQLNNQALIFQKLFELFIIQFNTTTDSAQIINNINNYLEVYQMNPHITFNKLIDQGYRYNFGVNMDKKIALKLFLEVAESGSGIGQYYVGMSYSCLDYGVKDEKKSLEWYIKSAEGGNPIGLYALGKYYQNTDYTKSFTYFIKSSQSGNSYAQFELAKCYNYGTGTIKNEAMSLELYLKSAENGNCDAQFYLANYYNSYSKGKNRDVEKTFKWYMSREAFEWFLKSANSGNCNAQYQLGIFYKNGIETPIEIKIADRWFELAKANG